MWGQERACGNTGSRSNRARAVRGAGPASSRRTFKRTLFSPARCYPGLLTAGRVLPAQPSLPGGSEPSHPARVVPFRARGAADPRSPARPQPSALRREKMAALRPPPPSWPPPSPHPALPAAPRLPEAPCRPPEPRSPLSWVRPSGRKGSWRRFSPWRRRRSTPLRFAASGRRGRSQPRSHAHRGAPPTAGVRAPPAGRAPSQCGRYGSCPFGAGGWVDARPRWGRKRASCSQCCKAQHRPAGSISP